MPAEAPSEATREEIARHAEARLRWPGATMVVDDCGGRYYFDPEAASLAEDFFAQELYLVSAGYKPFALLDWQAQLAIRPLFGWKRTAFGCGCAACGGEADQECREGLRRFQKLYLEVGKKNGKSPLLSGIGLFLLHCDREPAAEVYAVASEKEQARIVFNEARDMNAASPDLDERAEVLRHSIVIPSTGSSFKVLSPVVKSKHGPRVHGLLFDEFHAQQKRDLYDTLYRGTSSRRQPVVVLATTAGEDTETVCFDEHELACRVIEDSALPTDERRDMDEATLPVIFAADPEDDWTKPATWRKANPSLGVTKRTDYMEKEVRAAQRDPKKLSSFKRLDLNIWLQAHEAWLDISKWDACKAPEIRIPRDAAGRLQRTEDRVIVPPGCDVVAGIDLASKLDLTAFAVLVRRKDRDRELVMKEIRRKDAQGNEIVRVFEVDYGIDVHCWFWIPEVTMHRREKEDKVPYSTWLSKGSLRVTSGEVVDYNEVFEEIAYEILPYFEACGSPVQEAGFDPANATMFTNALHSRLGLKVTEVVQTVNGMSDPAKMLQALILDRRVRQDGNPVLRWNMGNVSAKEDKKENIFPYKASPKKRIDGAIASIIATNRLMFLEAAPPQPEAYFIPS